MASQRNTKRSARKHSGHVKSRSSPPSPAEILTYHAAKALGRGFDATDDFRIGPGLGSVRGAVGTHFVEVDDDHDHTQDLITPTGVVIHDVSRDIKLEKGEQINSKSGVLSYSQMCERFNEGASISEEMPLGLFNSMYGFKGPWKLDADATKSLALDGWFITLYSLQLVKSPLILTDEVKRAVPSSWEPKALASFIQKYGTHIIVGVKIGGKNVVYVKQSQRSSLQEIEVARLTQKYADEHFQKVSKDRDILDLRKRAGKEKISDSSSSTNSDHRFHGAPTYNTKRVKLKEGVEIWYRRRGGDDTVENHHEWMKTVPESPDVIAMSFVPLHTLLDGVAGAGFLSRAVDLYLRYRPPIDDLHYFLDFQVPRQWSPTYELPLETPQKEPAIPSIQFSLMSPKLYISTTEVSVGRKPVIGLRLFLEDKKGNKLAIHLQHLSTLPKVLQRLWNDRVSIGASVWREPLKQDSQWIEPVLWKNFSHVSTAPVELSESWIGDPTGTYIVTGAQLQVWDFGMQKKVLFLRLLYSKIPGCSIRRSIWDQVPVSTGGSGLLATLGLIGQSLEKAQEPDQSSDNFSTGSKKPSPNPKLLKLVDLSEMTRGAQDTPGHWLVTGAKLDLETRKISLRVKYSLLHYESELSESSMY